MTEENKFIPKGQPLSADELAEYTSNGEVAITRGDVEKAIRAADPSLEPYLKATQYKSKK